MPAVLPTNRVPVLVPAVIIVRVPPVIADVPPPRYVVEKPPSVTAPRVRLSKTVDEVVAVLKVELPVSDMEPNVSVEAFVVKFAEVMFNVPLIDNVVESVNVNADAMLFESSIVPVEDVPDVPMVMDGSPVTAPLPEALAAICNVPLLNVRALLPKKPVTPDPEERLTLLVPG